jgi:hypothetical protein
MSETRARRARIEDEPPVGRGWGRRVALAVVLAAAVTGCAIPFGPGGEEEPRRTPRERNRLYLEEQERIEQQRQTLEPIRPSER